MGKTVERAAAKVNRLRDEPENAKTVDDPFAS
jgi:hypothetical protein